MKKGIIQILPIIVVALIISGGISLLSIKNEKDQKLKVGQVLSSSSDGDREDEDDEDKVEIKENKSETNKSGSSTSSKSNIKIKSTDKKTKTQVEVENDKTKIEIEGPDGTFKSETEDDKQETKIRTGNLRIEYKIEGGRVVTKIKNENDEEVELENEDENDLIDELENELEDDEIEIATDSAQGEFSHKGRRVRTNFPLSVNPQTGELFVTTPSGTKVVAILPDVAIQNMIRGGVITRIDDGQLPSVSPTPEGTASSQEADSDNLGEASIEIVEENDTPVYLINGVKSEKLLGVWTVDLKLKTVVSVTNGQLIDIRQGLFFRILDLFSI